YLGEVLKRQIIPIIILNLIIGFVVPGIDISAHIGGLIGGYLITMALGLEGKSTKKDMLNGSIVLILYIAFLSFIVFFIK
ncbi:MAG: rhomboid family intramembrane serine protease, partial [Clostridia bacterium]